ncbi:glutamate acetyltransferase [Rhizobium leguminosarum]|uniref:glutamate acetyltransferase n=1 Tax=Rhizobium leguminosarum TaxID=384 RepID=UPI0021BBE33D|nr:glutamate acetyltransferase [Rhizobium leguminosarum]
MTQLNETMLKDLVELRHGRIGFIRLVLGFRDIRGAPERTDMNPFARTAAALFLVNGPKSNSPLDAEKICSALIQKLSEDASRNLEARTWQNAVQTVPYQVGRMKLTQTLNCTMPLRGLPDKLASMCTSKSQRPTLAKSIGSYLKQFGKPTAFNCLILDQSDTAEIHLSLTCLDVTEERNPEKFIIASTQVSAKLKLSNQQTQAAITEAFGSFQATSDQPFYLRTELIQIPTKSSSMEDTSFGNNINSYMLIRTVG